MNIALNTIEILPIKQFLFPGGQLSLTLEAEKFNHRINELDILNKEIGIPYWFSTKFNVFGCTALVKSMNINAIRSHVRINVKAKSIFRIERYCKTSEAELLNYAHVKLLDFSDQPIKSDSLINYFLELSESQVSGSKLSFTIKNLLNWLNLRPELVFAIITKESQYEREKFLEKVLYFLLLIKKQSNGQKFN